jgi:hypothetical protein
MNKLDAAEPVPFRSGAHRLACASSWRAVLLAGERHPSAPTPLHAAVDHGDGCSGGLDELPSR